MILLDIYKSYVLLSNLSLFGVVSLHGKWAIAVHTCLVASYGCVDAIVLLLELCTLVSIELIGVVFPQEMLAIIVHTWLLVSLWFCWYHCVTSRVDGWKTRSHFSWLFIILNHYGEIHRPEHGFVKICRRVASLDHSLRDWKISWKSVVVHFLSGQHLEWATEHTKLVRLLLVHIPKVATSLLSAQSSSQQFSLCLRSQSCLKTYYKLYAKHFDVIK